MSKDQVCVDSHKGAPILSESMLIDAATKGIQNIAMYPDRKKSGLDEASIHPSLAKPRVEPITLDNNKCVFIPHVAVRSQGERFVF